MCLCFYNKKNEQIWPCYPPIKWVERRCQTCSLMGDCKFSEIEGFLDCICVPLIRYGFKQDISQKNYLFINKKLLKNKYHLFILNK